LNTIRGIADSFALRLALSQKNGSKEKPLEVCKTCGKPKQIQHVLFGEMKTFPVLCDCEKAAIRKREHDEKVQRLTDGCFSGSRAYSRLYNARLDDKQYHADIAEKLKVYCKNFEQMEREQQGLLLYGTVGTGKSYLAAAVCNRLIQQEINVKFTSLQEIETVMKSLPYEQQAEALTRLDAFRLLVLDDLGAERNSEYMNQIVYDVVNRRWLSGKPLIVTTNLSISELKTPKEQVTARIYDRILQQCFPIKVDGESLRREDTKTRFFRMQNILRLNT